MLFLLTFFACSTDEVAPPGDWANVAPALAREVVPDGAHQLVSIEEGDLEFWVRLDADPPVAVGDTLLLGKGRTADVTVGDRTFDDVLSIDTFAVVSPEAAAGALAIPDLPADRDTIADLHAKRVEKAGKPVRAAGRVVKASMDVFDTNWYHLRDGSGSAAAEDDDLTFTTPAVLAVGDLVIASGPLTADKDLGFGYFYPVILEGAAVTGLDGAPLAERSEAVDVGTSGTPRTMRPEPAPPATPREPRPTQGPTAPGGRVVHGLELGVADDAALAAWTTGLDCSTEPAMARRTLHTRCKDAAARWPSEGSPSTEILIARPEEQTTIHHLSAARTHAAVEPALADFRASVAAARSRLGEPELLREPGPNDTFGGRMAYTATWRFDDLEVGVSLMRLRPSGDVTVRERWFVPGVEDALEDRGVGVHGSGIRSAPNPHAL